MLLGLSYHGALYLSIEIPALSKRERILPYLFIIWSSSHSQIADPYVFITPRVIGDSLDSKLLDTRRFILKMGIAEQTFYRWKKKFAGMGVAEVRRLRVLEEENRKLKQLVADLSLDKQMLQDVLRKKP